MADIEFRVDAVLGDTSQLQQQLNNLRTNLNLTIDNRQALQSIQAVQQQIKNVQRTMNNMNFNIGGAGGRGGGTRNGGNGVNALTAQFETTTLQKTDSLYRQISNTVNGTVKNIQVLRNEQGQIVSGVVTISNGYQTWRRNLEFVNGQYQRVIASGRDTISLSQKSNDLYRQREQHLKNISNIKRQLLTATGDEKRVLEQQLQSEQRLSKLVANRISRKNSSGVAMNQTNEGETRINQLKTQLAYEERLAQAKVRVKQATIEQNALNKLGMDTGTKLNTSSIKDIESLKTALSSANIGWNDNTHSIKQFSQHIDNAGNTVTKFTTRQKSVENGVEVWKDTSYAVSDADGKLRQYGQTQNQVLNTQQSLSTMLTSAIERFAVWGIAMKIWTGIGNAISDCISYTKELNSAMTNIRVVTMDTQEATEDLLKTYNQMAQRLGANTTDIASGAIDWLRQGFSEEDTAQLVESSTVLSKLALIDNAEATEYLTSALKGYKLEAKDAMGVIDQLTSIDLEAATSASDMAEAMSRTANMAKTTGFEMNELLGVIATVSEVTQMSASTVGNSMKTLLSRMSNVKAGVEIDPESGEALNDVEKVLNRVGIALRDNQGNWYDFYNVLDEIASRWDEFSDIQQSQITTALGGKQKPSATTYSNVWCLAV